MQINDNHINDVLAVSLFKGTGPDDESEVEDTWPPHGDGLWGGGMPERVGSPRPGSGGSEGVGLPGDGALESGGLRFQENAGMSESLFIPPTRPTRSSGFGHQNLSSLVDTELAGLSTFQQPVDAAQDVDPGQNMIGMYFPLSDIIARC